MASIFFSLCTIRIGSRIDGDRIFRTVAIGTGVLVTTRIAPRVLVVQRGKDTTLPNDVVGGFKQNANQSVRLHLLP